VAVKVVANPSDNFHREILGRHDRFACALDSKLRKAQCEEAGTDARLSLVGRSWLINKNRHRRCTLANPRLSRAPPEINIDFSRFTLSQHKTGYKAHGKGTLVFLSPWSESFVAFSHIISLCSARKSRNSCSTESSMGLAFRNLLGCDAESTVSAFTTAQPLTQYY